MRKYRPTIDKPRSRVKKYREGGPVGEPAGERIMLDEVDVVAPKFQPKGWFKGIRERIAKNINPFSYEAAIPRVVSAVLGNNKEQEHFFGWSEPALRERQALLDIAMGQPVRDEAVGALEVSEYRPSNSTDSSAVYFRSPLTEAEIKSQYDHRRNLRTQQEYVKSKEWLRLQNAYIDMLRNDVPYDEYKDDFVFVNRPKKDNKARGKYVLPLNEPFLGSGDEENFMYSGVLGNYTIGTGEDEKGTYISYYDNWDLDPFEHTNREGWTGAAEELQSKIGITSPEIYGRLYYKENPDGSITYLD